MTERKTIEEVLAGGIMAQMNHLNSEKVGQLFASDSDISDFDAYFMGSASARQVSYSLGYYADKSQVDVFLSSVLSRYFPNWLREKEALEAEYDLLWTGGGDSTTTETRHEEGTNKGTSEIQNQLNAFNGTDASDTDNQNREDNGEHDITTTVERSVLRKENSVTYTQAEVIEKELNLRMKYRFFDIVCNDLTVECCASVF